MYLSRCTSSLLLSLASASALACQSGGNIVTNCTFTGNANNWNQETGSCGWNSGAGHSNPGNYTCVSFAGMFGHVARFQRCLTAADGVIVGGAPYSYSAYSQLASGSGVTCTLEIADFTSNNCMNNVNAETTPLVLGAAPNYLPSTPDTYTVAANTVSISLRVACNAPAAFTVRVDDVFLAVEDPIFKNGFD